MSIKESKDSRTKRKQKTIHVTELEAGFTDNTTVALQSAHLDVKYMIAKINGYNE
nr:hypothetical protein [Bacillus sp. JAS24-2]